MKNDFPSNEPQEISITLDPSSLQGNILDTTGPRLDSLEEKFKQLQEKEFPTQFVFLNKSLNMNSGKAAAQAAHAVEELVYEIFTNASNEKVAEYKKYMSANPRAMIILEVADEDELYKLNSYLESQNIWTGIYVDEMAGGKKFVPTALAVEYLDRNEIRAKLLSGMFNKFTSVQEQNNEFYKKELQEIEGMALDSYFGKFFGSKDDMLKIMKKAGKASEAK